MNAEIGFPSRAPTGNAGQSKLHGPINRITTDRPVLPPPEPERLSPSDTVTVGGEPATIVAYHPSLEHTRDGFVPHGTALAIWRNEFVIWSASKHPNGWEFEAGDYHRFNRQANIAATLAAAVESFAARTGQQ